MNLLFSRFGACTVRRLGLCAGWLLLSTACGDSPAHPRADRANALENALPEASQRVVAAVARFRAAKPLPDYVTPKALLEVRQAIQRNDMKSAESLLTRRITEAPDDPHALYFRAFLNHRQKLYAAARPDFERVLEGGPSFPNASGVFLYYAWCCYYLADLDTAKSSFQAAFDLDVDKADATYGLGMVAFDRGELDAAAKAFERAQELFEAELEEKNTPPSHSDLINLAKPHVRLGTVLLRKADTAADEATGKALLADARRNLEAAVALIPFSDEAWFNLSRVYGRLGETELEKHALAKRDEAKAHQGH